MANIGSLLKTEIARIVRKELRGEIAALRKAASVHRREIAALKRRARDLERIASRQSRSSPATAAPPEANETGSASRRFSAKGLRSQRSRLGLSAAQCAVLLGTTAQSVYNWEQGKARPRARHLEAIAALKTLGKKSAAALLVQ